MLVNAKNAFDCKLNLLRADCSLIRVGEFGPQSPFSVLLILRSFDASSSSIVMWFISIA